MANASSSCSRRTFAQASLALAGLGAACLAGTASARVAVASDASGESAAEDGRVVRIAALKGPTAMGLVKLMDAVREGDEPGYDVTLAASSDEITPLLVKGELDVACVPANLASVLYNKTEGGVRVLAVNTLGVLYIVETGDEVSSIADLAGRTVFASGKGATPEYALRYLLECNGLDPDADVDIEWKSEHAECLASLLAAPAGAVALLPQPFVTSAQAKSDAVRVAVDLTEAWDEAQEGAEKPSRLLTGVAVARAEFMDEHPDLVEKLMADYAASVAFVNENLDEAAELVGSFEIVTEEVARVALPACNIVFIEGAEMRNALEGYLGVLFEAEPSSVGGTLPGDDFYYGAEQVEDEDADSEQVSAEKDPDA